MRSDRIRIGQIYLVEIRGHRFEARLTELELPWSPDRVGIEPLSAKLSYRSATRRQLIRRLQGAQLRFGEPVPGPALRTGGAA